MIKIIKVKRAENNSRLDKCLKRIFNSITQSFIEKNLRKKNILVNNLKASSNQKVQFNDEIKIFNYDIKKFKSFNKVKKNIYISEGIKKKFRDSIIYENKNFIILNKWSGISTQGGSKITISIDHIIKNISKNYNLVHRLDKDTSGLLIISKNLVFTKLFGIMFKKNIVRKTYFAFCQGKPKIKESLLELNISSKKDFKIKNNTTTYYKLIDYKNYISLVIFKPKTGKTHQLRIVSKNLGCPIIGDKRYNSQTKYNDQELMLHAHTLEFEIKSKQYNFVSKIPDNIINFAKKKNINILKKIKSY